MQDRTNVWVLAYILRISGEDGEWPQVHRRSFASEQEARDYVAKCGGGYQVCRVELPQ